MSVDSVSQAADDHAQAPPPFTPYQKFVVALLAFLQFTIILDFMVLSPLGAFLMPAMRITPQQFGVVVAVYAFSAGISSFLAAGFADRFDRKKFLLFFYGGFIIGTFLCAVAATYEFLLFARVITGLFGGVVGSIVMAVTTDLFPLNMRGRVLGIIQTAFASSQVLGLPAGIFFSNLWGWQAPFYMIGFMTLIVGVVIWFFLRPVDAHLQLKQENAFPHLIATIINPQYFLSFIIVTMVALGGFMIMPFASAFSVNNLGINLKDLPFLYLLTGIAAIVVGPLIGRLADMYSKFRVFLFGSLLFSTTVFIYTRLEVTPFWIVVMISILNFVGISSRMIPFQAIMSAVPDPKYRGSFMSVSASMQQVSGGLASVIAGWIVLEGENGRLQRFDLLGDVVVLGAVVTVFLLFHINRSIQRKLAHLPVDG